MKTLLAISGSLLMAATLFSCSQKSTQMTVTVPSATVTPSPGPQREMNFIPKATAFQMSGDYADHVAITLGNDGKLLYYPDPSDIRETSKPVDLGNGWWLNRQGLGPNSVFTKYTFEQYAKLKTCPTQQELIESIIPGARVTSYQALPCRISEGMEKLPELREFVKNL